MRGYDLHWTMSLTDKPDKYFVELYTQSDLRYLWSRVYHWYDMRVYKVPGFKLVEKFHVWFYQHQGDDYIPLPNLQDMRCYHLTSKGRVAVTRFEITKEQYDAWKGFKTSDT